MSAEPDNDLVNAVQNGSALFVVGTGSSIAAVGGPNRTPTVTWTGLIEDGLRCVQQYQGKSDVWLNREIEKLRESFSEGDLDGILEQASIVQRRLGGGGEWAKWLRRAIGELEVVDLRVPSALISLSQGRLLTTNYDDVLTVASGETLAPIPWTNARKVARVLRGEDNGVVHLHGHWDHPESVVLGLDSYGAVVRDEHTQAMQRAVATLRCLVFVGFGGGLEDPNLGPLVKWLGTFWTDEHEHFRLARAGEVDTIKKSHSPLQRIKVLSYGDGYQDLAPYLENLVMRTNMGHRVYSAPSYSAPRKPLIPGLDEESTEALRFICSTMRENGNFHLFSGDGEDYLCGMGRGSREDMGNLVAELRDFGYVEAEEFLCSVDDRRWTHLSVTPSGYVAYAKVFVEGFDKTVSLCVAEIVAETENGRTARSNELAAKAGLSHLDVCQVFLYLNRRGMVSTDDYKDFVFAQGPTWRLKKLAKDPDTHLLDWI